MNKSIDERAEDLMAITNYFNSKDISVEDALIFSVTLLSALYESHKTVCDKQPSCIIATVNDYFNSNNVSLVLAEITELKN